MPPQILKVERRVAFRLDGSQVESRGLHEKRGSFLAKDVAIRSLEGSVAAAVQHQRFLTAQQARGVSSQSQIGSPLRRRIELRIDRHLDQTNGFSWESSVSSWIED